MGKRIVFTGGSGKAGRHVVPYLVAQGHQVLNVDLVPMACPGVNTITADLTDSGEAFNALSMHFSFDGLITGKGPACLAARRNTLSATGLVSTKRVFWALTNSTYDERMLTAKPAPHWAIRDKLVFRIGTKRAVVSRLFIPAISRPRNFEPFPAPRIQH